MSTEQTGRQSLDTTDSIELVLSPAGGDPTPLPEAHAADGTRKLKAAPPPIPSRTRSSTQTIPPPLPTRTSAQMPAVAQATSRSAPKPAHVRAKGTQPPVRMTEADPDGWVVPGDVAPKAEPTADALAQQIDALAPKLDGDGKIEAPKLDEVKAAAESVDVNMNDDGEGLRDIMDEDPEGPDATTATPFAEPVVDAGPSKEWLAKIDSVLRPEASAPVAFTKPDAQQPALFTTKAAATMFAAPAPQNTEPLELVDLEAVEPPKAKLPAPVSSLPQPAPVATKPASVAKLPAPVSSLPQPAPQPALAIAPQPTVKPMNARRAPIATPGGYPVVSELDGPTDQDAGEFDVDFESNPDLTSAHTTNFDMPERQRFISQRMAIAMFAGAAVLTIAYLATRGGEHKKPTRTAAAETAPAEAPAPAPQPVVQPIAAPAQQAPAQQAAAPAQQIAAAPVVPAAPTQGDVIQVPVSSKPSGALVSFVDGGHAVVVGRTPTTIMLDPTQPHDIALTLVDHETQLVTVPIGGMTALAVDMGPEKAGAMAKAPQQVVAAEPREETAAMVAPKAVAKHEAPRHEAPAPKAQHITQPAPRAETPAAPSGSGTLMISSKPPCEIVVDGKPTHLSTPQRALSLTPGTHTVVLVNAGMKIRKTLAVTISAKKPTKVIQDFTQQ